MPSVQVKIDRDRAAAFGVSPQQIETALGSAFGGQQISQINTSSNQYEVIMELLPRYQRDASALDRLYITGASNTLVPLTAVTDMTASTVPLSVNHAGQIPAVTISFDLAPGKALSDAVTRHPPGQRGHRHARLHSGQFPGHRRRLRGVHQEYGHAAGHRHGGGLHHPGHSL